MVMTGDDENKVYCETRALYHEVPIMIVDRESEAKYELLTPG